MMADNAMRKYLYESWQANLGRSHNIVLICSKFSLLNNDGDGDGEDGDAKTCLDEHIDEVSSTPSEQGTKSFAFSAIGKF